MRYARKNSKLCTRKQNNTDTSGPLQWMQAKQLPLANPRLLRFPANLSQKASINMTAGSSPMETLANEM